MGNFDSSGFYSKFLSKLGKPAKNAFLGHFSSKYFVLYIVSIQKSIREVAREFHFFQSLPKLFEINAH